MASMDSNKMKRLEQEHEKNLQQCLLKQREWEKVQSDYDSLSETLTTLPDKITHEIMVPFGSLAFMPGKMVHTNEITVLLGENWFVERSAKQAIEIIGRRKATCEKTLQNLKMEENQILEWIKYSKELKGGEDLVEIVEEFDPEKEKVWRENHKLSVRKFKETQKLDSNENETEIIKENGKLQVKWKEPSTEPPQINFSHSNVPASNEKPPAQQFPLNSANIPIIQSPTDIYKQFLQPNTKSILKQTETDCKPTTNVDFQPKEKVISTPTYYKKVAKSSKNVLGAVVEKEIPTEACVVEQTERRLSKFKAKRLSRLD